MLESRYNLDVTVAIHGQEALEVMASGIQFDLILMDLMMPVMGGYDCFTEIIRIYGDKRPVVWALTASTSIGKYSKRRRSNVAVIVVRIVFIRAFLFYCLLLNHSF